MRKIFFALMLLLTLTLFVGNFCLAGEGSDDSGVVKLDNPLGKDITYQIAKKGLGMEE